jgi:HlyD family secretion protein
MNPAPNSSPNHKARPLRFVPWLAAAALAGLIAFGLRPRPTPVEIATVSSGPLRATVNEEGKTRIKQRFTVAAPLAGNLRRIPFKAGAEVTAGETVIAVIDPLLPAMLDARHRAQAEARRDSAAAQLEKAKESLRFATSEHKRFKKLHEDKVLSDQELEGAEWRETSATKELAAAESTLRAAELELAQFNGAAESGDSALAPVEIKAPSSGRVLRVFEESARAVTAGTPLVEIGNPADLEVIIEVLSRDGAAIPPGTRVELDQWGGAEPLQAVVRLVEPAAFTKVSALGVEEQRVNVVADLVTPFEQRRGVGDQFRVEARIIVWETDRVLKVPAGALFRQGRDWAAYVITDGLAQLHPVEAGRSSGVETQILKGLEEGETVILYPGERIHDGQRVRPIQISP